MEDASLFDIRFVFADNLVDHYITAFQLFQFNGLFQKPLYRWR